MSLNFGKINKRYVCRSPKETSSVCHESVVKMNVTTLDKSLQEAAQKENAEINSRIERNCSQFIDSISNIENSGRFVDEAIVFISEIDKVNEGYADYMVDQVVSKVLPYADHNDLQRVQYRLTENEYGILTDSQKSKLQDAIKENIVADRILENHNKISKRFNIEQEIMSLRAKGLERTVESVCSIVNTYNIEPYQKLNICIEEMTYLLDKNGIEYNRQNLVREAVEDIIMTNELDLHNLKGYNKALTESYCLECDDLAKVGILSDGFGCGESLSNYIDNYLINPDKSYATLLALCMKIAKTCSVYDIKANIGKVIFLVRKCCVFGMVDADGATSCLQNMANTLAEREDMDGEVIDQILANIDSCTKDKVFCHTYPVKDDQDCSDAVKDCCTNGMCPTLVSAKNIYYDKANLEAMQFFGNNTETIALNEFKLFKFNNLIKAAFNLDKYLKIKGRQLMKKPKTKLHKFIAKARNVLFGEDASEEIARQHLGAFLTENHVPDICVAIYEYKPEAEAELKEFLAEVCKSYNDTLLIENNNDTKSYYIMNCGVAEVHIRENVRVLTDTDSDFQKEISFEEAYYMNLFSDTVELMEEASTNHLTSIEDFITEFCNNSQMTKEHFKVALEALSILGASEEEIDVFKESYKISKTAAANESAEIDDLDSIVYEAADQEIVTENEKLEAFNTLAAVLEAPQLHKPKVGYSNDEYADDEDDDWDDDEDDDDDEEDEKPAKKEEDKKEEKSEESDQSAVDKELSAKKSKKKFGVDLNSLKLAMLGMKKKFGDMGQKEKELSKNLDNNVTRLVKGMKDALISDRREAVIKGSVIPSFSKCIKIAIALAGVAKFIDPGLAIIAAIGGFALSKHLTHKERILLLDDIEVELDVVEKEIGLAESRNQMNKYRALQKYKKDLQRQYQRIKYNVRVGKDILPNSTMGIKQYD